LKYAAREFDSLELEDIEKILDAQSAKGEEVIEVWVSKSPLSS